MRGPAHAVAIVGDLDAIVNDEHVGSDIDPGSERHFDSPLLAAAKSALRIPCASEITDYDDCTAVVGIANSL